MTRDTLVAFVEEARSDDSPIHRLLTWDDGIAGKLYRRAVEG